MNATDSSSRIRFKTTAGVFTDSNNSITVIAKKPVDQDIKLAEVTLKSSLKEENAVVTVEIFDVKKDVEIKFTKSFPEKIKLFPSALSIAPSNGADGEINLEAFISKFQGSPSVKHQVDINAYNSSDKKVGSFRIYNSESNEAGKTNYVFVLGDSVANNSTGAYIGKVHLIASALTSPGKYIHDTITIISSR